MNTQNGDSFDPAFLKFYTRVLVILTSLGVAALLLAIYILPRGPAAFVGPLALLFSGIAVSHLVFFGATRISMALTGSRRIHFQVAISVAVPVVLASYLVSQVDALSMETLWSIFTPWLLLPMGIISWLCWNPASQLNREHPFRGFLIASAALFVLCLLLSRHHYVDLQNVNPASDMGEYVWRFVLYVATAYVVLFLKWRRS